MTPNPYQLRILAALNYTGRHVYAGAETDQERAARRRGMLRNAGRATSGRAGRRLVARADRAEARSLRRRELREGVAA